MSKFSEGDMVVLISGSMRMAVESVEGETVNVVWCHEGKVGRDSFSEKLLNKWEHRGEDARGGGREDRGGPRGGRDDRGGGGFRGRDRDDRGGPPRGGRDDRGGPRDREERPRGKTGWDGRPRDKKHFRKDD